MGTLLWINKDKATGISVDYLNDITNEIIELIENEDVIREIGLNGKNYV